MTIMEFGYLQRNGVIFLSLLRTRLSPMEVFSASVFYIKCLIIKNKLVNLV